jgi:hypothetical protein
MGSQGRDGIGLATPDGSAISSYRRGGDIVSRKECFGAEIWSRGEEVPPIGAVRLNYGIADHGIARVKQTDGATIVARNGGLTFFLFSCRRLVLLWKCI